MLRKKLISISALSLLSALAVAVPAQAAHVPAFGTMPNGADDSFGAASCVFSGLSGQAPNKVQAIGNDVGDGLTDTDGGTFTFDGPATCAGADAGGSTVGAVGPVTVAIDADGVFTNLVCGTGHAEGDATVTGGGINLRSSFGITFAAGNGKIAIDHIDGTVAVTGEDQDVDSGSGAGYVNIRPHGENDGGNCITNDVGEFDVAGTFGVSLSGDAANNNS